MNRKTDAAGFQRAQIHLSAFPVSPSPGMILAGSRALVQSSLRATPTTALIEQIYLAMTSYYVAEEEVRAGQTPALLAEHASLPIPPTFTTAQCSGTFNCNCSECLRPAQGLLRGEKESCSGERSGELGGFGATVPRERAQTHQDAQFLLQALTAQKIVAERAASASKAGVFCTQSPLCTPSYCHSGWLGGEYCVKSPGVRNLTSGDINSGLKHNALLGQINKEAAWKKRYEENKGSNGASSTPPPQGPLGPQHSEHPSSFFSAARVFLRSTWSSMNTNTYKKEDAR